MAFVMIPVTGTFKLPTGLAAAGTVEFQLSTAIHDSATDQIRVPVPVLATLDANGSFAISLVSALSAGIQPEGVTYAVIERIAGAPLRVYHISI